MNAGSGRAPTISKATTVPPPNNGPYIQCNLAGKIPVEGFTGRRKLTPARSRAFVEYRLVGTKFNRKYLMVRSIL